MPADQLLFEVSQQRGIAGRVVRPDIVRLVDDAAAQQPIPDAVGDGSGKPRVLGRDQPIGEDFPRVPVGRQLGLLAVREYRLDAAH